MQAESTIRIDYISEAIQYRNLERDSQFKKVSQKITNMKTKLLFIVSIIFLAQVSWASEYTRSYDFKPICIESKELFKTVTEIIDYCRLNSGVPIAAESYIRFGGDGHPVQLSFPLKKDTLDKYPVMFYECYINIKFTSDTEPSFALILI